MAIMLLWGVRILAKILRAFNGLETYMFQNILRIFVFLGY
jgi:hypothetical protein